MKNEHDKNRKSVHLGLRLINEAIIVAADRVHGYGESALMQQGTTATHVVFSNVSKFSSFIDVFLQCALEPACHERICSKTETR
jgi:hypothetical protein